jgi:hypothetical protein
VRYSSSTFGTAIYSDGWAIPTLAPTGISSSSMPLMKKSGTCPPTQVSLPPTSSMHSVPNQRESHWRGISSAHFLTPSNAWHITTTRRYTLAEVRAKLGKEEAKSYHLAFPRSIAYFIDGLFIAFMSWVVQKGSGRIVVDSSTPLDKTDRGALNAHIPKPGLPGSLDRNPRITYANAFVRHLIHLWNLRITNPRQEILQHTDDIEASTTTPILASVTPTSSRNFSLSPWE